MNEIQEKILEMLSNAESIPLKLRAIGRVIGVDHPQVVKYHLQQLEKQGYISIDDNHKEIHLVPIKTQNVVSPGFSTIPILGDANCGPACLYASNNIEGFLKISQTISGGITPQNTFAIRAKGDSMNNANIGGKSIESGDFVLVDNSVNMPDNGDYVVSIIDECANIKRFYKEDNQITLLSESKQNFPPIFIHEDDKDSYIIAGKVVRVLKGPKN